MAASNRNVRALLELAIDMPGFTYDDVEARLGWDYGRFMRTVRATRLHLYAGGYEYSLPCEPQGQRERWLYQLVGNADHDAFRAWEANRVDDTETRLGTMEAVMTVIAARTDGRTLAGRKARMIASTVKHLRETLAIIGETR